MCVKERDKSNQDNFEVKFIDDFYIQVSEPSAK